ncbi:hypothetical protein ABB37_07054 [Leptomonas pyrrhocoris]|uniref:Uncharacterized protein n=1 Tax=Leptomonas pyrrhocoris TaxID=157538 RepID=A0A0M9FX75_LEPPY|nr:hypothetical protein ABB37_07054 [Leptomonas pyrrhocoris]KPA77736.1 hypothetical protein ABB37_07054 [Leptomonas pyrrhocoris]|eukprot:XP_015656175.1 hypothetical protein ABB37_07054 [Leptomonas pyrrhocoris]
MATKQAAARAKTAAPAITVAQELHVDSDLRRLLERCAAFGEQFAPFAKRVKAELLRVKDGEQTGVPQIPLFVRGEIALAELKAFCNDALQPYPYLRVVQLHHSLIGDDGVLTLCEFLKRYEPLPDRNPFGIQRLELPGCAIGSRGCRQLGNFLSNNATVERLVLDFNPLGDAGVQELCSGLRWNSAVTSLSLQYCDIGPAGASYLASRVVKESNVSTLSLRGNHIGDSGVDDIAKAICVTSKIADLDLADTACVGNTATVISLCEAIESAATLRVVDLDMNMLTSGVCECLLKSLQASKSVTALRVNERTDPVIYKQIVSISATRSSAGKGKKKGKKKE